MCGQHVTLNWSSSKESCLPETIADCLVRNSSISRDLGSCRRCCCGSISKVAHTGITILGRSSDPGSTWPIGLSLTLWVLMYRVHNAAMVCLDTPKCLATACWHFNDAECNNAESQPRHFSVVYGCVTWTVWTVVVVAFYTAVREVTKCLVAVHYCAPERGQGRHYGFSKCSPTWTFWCALHVIFGVLATTIGPL